MALLQPLFQQQAPGGTGPGTYSATQTRELLDSLFSSSGIIGSGDLVVAQRASGANMSVDVAAGSCVVTGTDVSGQGKYLCKSTAVANVTIATAPSTGNSRIDLIVAQVRDADESGGSNNDWIITAVTGTPATTGSQVAPTVPASALVLAHIAVGPTVSTIVNANISDYRGLAGQGAGSVIEQITYGPSTQATPTVGISIGAVDSTNLAPTFIGPSTGKVKITAKIWAGVGSSAAIASNIVLAFVTHGTTTLVTPREEVLYLDSSSPVESVHQRVTYGAIVSVTPGTVYQWDLAAYSASAGSVLIDDGLTGSNTAGPAIITVEVA